MQKVSLLFIVGILLSLLIRSYLILNGSEVGDIHTLWEMGDLTLRGINPYIALNYNAYPPLALYLQSATIQLSNTTGIPFYILIKLWPNLADLLIALLIYLFLIKKGSGKITASVWSMIFFLNPVSIIISASHGQIDSIPTLLIISSILLTVSKTTFTHTFLCALFLGFAIAIKPNPLILLPLFLTVKKTSIKNTILFLLLSVVPTLLLIWPFLQDYPGHILPKLLNYSGSNDFGIPAILRGLKYLQTPDYMYFLSEGIIKASKAIFLLALFFLILLFRNSNKIIQGCLAAYLLFFTIYFGISAQYLSWVLPLAVLVKDRMVIPYSIASFFALLGFYLLINPKILISQFAQIQPFQGQFMFLYVFGNVLLIIINMVWLAKIFRRGSLLQRK